MPSLLGNGQNERERTLTIKRQLEEELRHLEDEIDASFSDSGFDRCSSLVFNPTNPETSIEDCLAVMGDRLARELGNSLSEAVHTLLTGPLDYQRFRETMLALSRQAHGGWSKVLVPLVLLQALQGEGQCVETLLHLGVRSLEEDAADYIIQQGGWGEVFRLQSEEDQGETIAEDSNDIYILSGEQHPDHLSPPLSLLGTGDNSSEQSSWQTESLPVSLAGHESWAQVSAMDPEDVKSLDSNEGVALAEERSENNSSNSDIVHVEREEAELLEEGGEVGAIEESMMSVLGTENELVELREEFRDQTPPVPVSADVDSTAPASLVSLDESMVIETPASLSAEPSLISSEPELITPAPEENAPPPAESETTAPLPVPAAEPEPEPEPAAESTPVPAEVAPPPLDKETPTEPAEPEAPLEQAPEPEQELEPAAVPPQPDPETVAEPAPDVPQASEVAEAHVEATSKESPVQPESPSEFPVLIYGGAALVALAAVGAYCVLSCRRK
uniref:BCL2 like 13 n=1 Tax=Echeneis naucrates TaxID=173247 RepID=A0A665UIR9_ECHNA